jgi:antitoxin FitA
MPTVTVRNLSEEAHSAIKRRAVRNGRSMEAEIRIILEESVTRKSEIKIGSELAAFGRRLVGLTSRSGAASEACCDRCLILVEKGNAQGLKCLRENSFLRPTSCA